MGAEDQVRELVASVPPASREAEEEARRRHSRLTKPPGSLGVVEELGARLSAMTGTCPPPVPRRAAVIVAAGDHGVLARGVSPWPKEVTALMVRAFCEGRAAVNAIAGAVGAEVFVLDVGVAADLPPHPRLKKARVRPGTGDLSMEPAMSREEAALALLAGARLAREVLEGLGEAGTGGERRDLLVTGDMGIGNTTPAACLVAAFTGLPAALVTGRGTGIDDATFEKKVKVVESAVRLHAPDPRDPLGVLASVGGLEHAALAGVALAGAANRTPVILDGVNSVAAALAAAALCPHCVDYLIAGHLSTEPGAAAGLKQLGLRPLLDLSMRLGEGTGGLLAIPIVRASAAVLAEMATFEEAGIGVPD